MLDAPVDFYVNQGVEPLYEPDDALLLNINLPPSVTYSRGQILGQVTSSANAVQTVTISGSPTGGTFTLTASINGVSQTTAAIAFNAAASAVQTALRALTIFGSNLTVTGTGPYTVTFNSALAGTPIPTMTASGAGLTGGSSPSVVVAATTVGRSAGTYVAYDGTILPAPTTAPTVAGNGTGSSFAAGTYLVSYTISTAIGESTPSPATAVTATAAQNLRVSAISSLNAAVTRVTYYVNGVWAAETTPASGTAAQTDLSGATLATGRSAPTINNAYTAPNGSGSQIPRAILRYAVATDSSGFATFGTVAGTGHWGETSRAVPAWFSGDFRTTELVGLDANAIATWPARLVQGTAADGILRLP